MNILFYAKGTAALPPHIVLEEIGAPYEVRRVDFAANEQQSSDYLEVNPRGRVPALVTPDGILTEAPAILTYLGQTNPEAGLIPSDPFTLARAQEFNSYVCATVHVAHAHRVRGHRWTDDAAAIESMKSKVAQNMTDCAEMMQNHFLRGEWVLGDNYSICDPYLFLACRWIIADGANIDDFPALRAHYDRMLARPAVAKVLPLHE
ncbi:glutathione S-transferase [Brevirhabdus pacifica]|uniref:Glutathione S-transferase n=1 Tax=Brevirhabdus pacifica TaxID=1267768 RepID=A0A1U7DEK5_9RHOB|nr:glutathione S-transferase family protein [Brevirhabdus pacifica]APX88427.1 glutathione S-transferase [Brevirhabdus pacifica]OWU79735.1 glutathione S-transferase [Loktanella sp. 22II-4b]PJJ87109.1 glutathione S-transferase [Brevirhabdus pacifica]